MEIHPYYSHAGGLAFCLPETHPVGQDNDLVIHVPSGCVLSWGKAEAQVVVAVAGVVPVTDSGTDVPAVVDPRAATNNTVIAC